jgi:L-amino acid N-acyltransferase YncA
LIAEEGTIPVGAAWWRTFTRRDPGYGFVDEFTPELSIGVLYRARRRGVGAGLLRALIDAAQRCALPALSLSVAPDNPAASLYRRLGFEELSTAGGSITMALRLIRWDSRRRPAMEGGERTCRSAQPLTCRVHVVRS